MGEIRKPANNRPPFAIMLRCRGWGAGDGYLELISPSVRHLPIGPGGRLLFLLSLNCRLLGSVLALWPCTIQKSPPLNNAMKHKRVDSSLNFKVHFRCLPQPAKRATSVKRRMHTEAAFNGTVVIMDKYANG